MLLADIGMFINSAAGIVTVAAVFCAILFFALDYRIKTIVHEEVKREMFVFREEIRKEVSDQIDTKLAILKYEIVKEIKEALSAEIRENRETLFAEIKDLKKDISRIDSQINEIKTSIIKLEERSDRYAEVTKVLLDDHHSIQVAVYSVQKQINDHIGVNH